MTGPRVNREVWANALPWLLDRLVDAVRDEDPERIRHTLGHVRSLTAPDGRDPADAALIALAACLPKGISTRYLLGWVDRRGDELDWAHEQTRHPRRVAS